MIKTYSNHPFSNYTHETCLPSINPSGIGKLKLYSLELNKLMLRYNL